MKPLLFILLVSCATAPQVAKRDPLPVSCEAESKDTVNNYIKFIPSGVYPEIENELMQELTSCGCRRWPGEGPMSTCQQYVPWKEGSGNWKDDSKLTWQKKNWEPGGNRRFEVSYHGLKEGKVVFSMQIFCSDGKQDTRCANPGTFERLVEETPAKTIANSVLGMSFK